MLGIKNTVKKPRAEIRALAECFNALALFEKAYRYHDCDFGVVGHLLTKAMQRIEELRDERPHSRTLCVAYVLIAAEVNKLW